ncbi:hypothetical protein MMC30_002312 [Trapelia coarctata]|nr:hypothetical protein [Trapelia coarctata]
MQGRRGQPSRLPASRLPPIAPKDDLPSSSDARQSASLASSIATDLPRTRLPPRSRNGCWTCRQRKVKFVVWCNQCTRLGHTCDYSHKVAFKDETQKVVNKYLRGHRSRSRRWNPSAELTAEAEPPQLPEEDLLPSFTSLTNEDDWQKKAGHQPPGTFYVVANPESFQHLEEYRQVRSDQDLRPLTRFGEPERGPQTPVGGTLQTPITFQAEEGYRARANTAIDPKTIVLGTFEEDLQRTPHWGLVSPPSAHPGRINTLMAQSPDLTTFTRGLDDLSVSAVQPLQNPPPVATGPTEQEIRLLLHYRTFVSRHIVQIRRDHTREGSLPGTDVFEQEASTFPPLKLFHALMALSASSLAHRDGSQNIDALQYYEKALTPLQNNSRNEQDLASNGTFFTHFILLLYEIAAAEPLWPTYLANLDRIAQVRHDLYGAEPFPAVLWWVCIIDISALLSGCGAGSFIANMVSRGQVPTTANLLGSPMRVERDAPTTAEARMMPAVLEFHRTISLLAAELGFLARELRQFGTQDLQELPRARIARIALWQQQVLAMRDKLKRAWRTQIPYALANNQSDQVLPARIRGVFEHTYLVYRTCIIYSHTSMWSTQRVDINNGYGTDVSDCASEIIEVANETVQRRQYEHGFVMFPLFLAGFATLSATEKMQAHELMIAMEQESIGKNKRTTRKLLEAVYERQNERQIAAGHSLDVDWILVMRDMGLQLVNFGL